MKHLYTLLLFFLLIFSAGIENAFSAGIAAGDLTWTCVGKDSFLFKLVLYTDCKQGDPGNEVLKFYCSTTNTFLFSKTITKSTGIDITPICNSSCTRCSDASCSFPYGFQQFTYQALAVLTSAPCCEIKIRFQECCRNTDVTTLNPGTPFYTEATLNRCLSPCDNSPDFCNPPVFIICLGQDFVISHGVQDIDFADSIGLLDSLVAEFINPMQDSVNNISYNGGYSYNKPLYFWGYPDASQAFPHGFRVDFVTGNVSFRPLKIEQSILALKFSEYRNRVKIGEVRREMQVVVINCPANHAPSLGPAVYYKEVCAGNKVEFTINTNDPDPNDTLTISWNHGISGATWSDNNNKTNHPSGNFSWAPAINQASSVPYTFKVTVKDDACPVSGHFIQTFQVLVKPIPRAQITITDSAGGNYWFKADALQGKDPSYNWLGDNFSFSPSSGTLTFNHFNSAGKHFYQMTMTSLGCIQVYNDSIDVQISSSIDDEIAYPFVFSPNPAKNVLEINSKNNELISSVWLYNQSGQLVFSNGNINSKSYKLLRKNLKNGIYFIEIRYGENRNIRKKVVFE